jgi:hypothetical protein
LRTGWREEAGYISIELPITTWKAPIYLETSNNFLIKHTIIRVCCEFWLELIPRLMWVHFLRKELGHEVRMGHQHLD